ncbi:ABC transporter, ATP-binding protein [Campylobacter rectus RM3267]|uniref:Heme ABC transporter ChuBCD, ATP-binding protein n=3 Tax=Campylobacter rectus TaxID=203 RepID=A0A6G5QKY4_CAMRE|nr:ABC transporter ATP-binding protein [Campylobacter rectus]EEF14436.1 ABC transporter, ATP-binding protein [Campylobacter rectus RM3267]QCD46358.1 heme ABC transporter ChuBCD, ATP-binding protein [Campylobacter rectus]UEB47062.1 ABC transporter ATP-binding protein [Campylobacter rectus]
MKINELCFSYGKKEILKNIDLNFKNGEFVGILGPNGCGKSTLLKNILKILSPNSGIITLKNKKLEDYSLKELAKILGFVPQKTILNMPLTVEDIVLMGRFCHLKSQFSGYDANDVEKTYEIMRLLDVEKFAKRSAHSLSGGEFQRVLLARALVSEPKILLLDEPTSALDLSYGVQMLKICENLTRELKLLSVAVLHDLNLAAMFCDKLIMLKDGEIRHAGAAKELFTKEILYEIYGLNCEILEHNGTPFVAPTR